MIGMPVAKSTRSRWSFRKLIAETKKLIRSDFGGKKDSSAVLIKKAQKAGFNWSDEEADFVKKLIVDQIAGCRKRMSHNIKEMERRIG